MRRRAVLTAGVAAGWSLLALSAESAAANDSAPGVEFAEDGGRYEHELGGPGSPTMHARNMIINYRNVDPFEHRFEIERLDTGQWVRFEFESVGPDADHRGPLSFRLYDGAGEIHTPPLCSVLTPDGNVEYEGAVVAGDEDIFASGDVFGTYVFSLVDGDRQIASTDAKTYGIGYPGEYTEQRQNGTVDVNLPAIDELDADWKVTFEIENQVETEDGFEETVLYESELAVENGQLVTTYPIEELEPPPENGHQVRWVRFSSDDEPGSSLGIGGHFFVNAEALLLEDEGDIDVGVATETERNRSASDATPDPDDQTGVGAASALVGVLGGGYLASRRDES